MTNPDEQGERCCNCGEPASLCLASSRILEYVSACQSRTIARLRSELETAQGERDEAEQKLATVQDTSASYRVCAEEWKARAESAESRAAELQAKLAEAEMKPRHRPCAIGGCSVPAGPYCPRHANESAQSERDELQAERDELRRLIRAIADAKRGHFDQPWPLAQAIDLAEQAVAKIDPPAPSRSVQNRLAIQRDGYRSPTIVDVGALLEKEKATVRPDSSAPTEGDGGAVSRKCLECCEACVRWSRNCCNCGQPTGGRSATDTKGTE